MYSRVTDIKQIYFTPELNGVSYKLCTNFFCQKYNSFQSLNLYLANESA